MKAGSLRVTVTLIIVITLVPAWEVFKYRNVMLLRRPLLPVTFVHGLHKGIQCTHCHHNYIDDSGGGSCYLCHKLDPGLARNIETTFHVFCTDCHIKTKNEGDEAGPVRQCGPCHDQISGNTYPILDYQVFSEKTFSAFN